MNIAFNEFRDFEILSRNCPLLDKIFYTSIMVGKSKYKKVSLEQQVIPIKLLLQQHHLPQLDEIACLEAIEVYFACIPMDNELFLDTYLIKLPGVKL